MSKPTPDSDIIQPSAARASSIGSPVARAQRGGLAALPPTAAVRSPWARAVSQRSSASSARSRASIWSVTSASTRSTHAAASS